MQKIYELIDEAILFAEKYSTYNENVDGDSIYWSQEELTTTFVYKDDIYSIYQIWSKNKFHNNHVITVYKNGEETNFTDFYLRTFLIEVRKYMQELSSNSKKESN